MPKKPPKKWTLIFLLSAKNNLYLEQLNVIKEIYSVGSSAHVNFVIILDGLSGDKFADLMEKPGIFFVKKKTDFMSDPVYYRPKWRNSSLNNKVHLEALLRKVVRDFKADQYGFFYKGHGGAGITDIAKGSFDTRMVHVDVKWKDKQIEKKYAKEQPGWTFEGYCEYTAVKRSKKNLKPVLLVYSRKNTGSLSYNDLGLVLKKIFRGKLGFLCMDCCWAQQIENAYNFKGVTNYYIASADEMPALGLGYVNLCNHFINRPTIRPEEAANLIVALNFNQNYADYDGDIAEFRKMGVSITCVCLEDYDKFLKPFRSVCKRLTKKLELRDRYTYKMFQAARRNCLDYTYKDTDKLTLDKVDYPLFNIDLIWLFENLLYYNVDDKLDYEFQDIIHQLRNNLISSYMGNNYKKAVMGQRAIGGKGISVCFPKNQEFADNSLLAEEGMEFYKDSGWKELLTTYYSCTPKIKFEDEFETEADKKFFISAIAGKGDEPEKDKRVKYTQVRKRKRKKQG